MSGSAFRGRPTDTQCTELWTREIDHPKHASNTPSNAWLLKIGDRNPHGWKVPRGKVFRRDVAQATPQQIRHAIEMASRLNPGPWGGDFKPFEFKIGEGRR